MKIDYAIISSDDNPMYKDFYNIVAQRWFDIGIKTYYINITTEDSITENKYGFIHKIKAINDVPTSFQSQVVRLFASKLIEGNLIMSDIDMLPINKDYFIKNSNYLSDNNVVVYSGQPYGNVPYYPMCYVLSNSKTFVKYLEIDDIDFKEYCLMLLGKYGESWNTDEHFMYDQFQKNINNIYILNDRDFGRRIDRGNWRYQIDLLKNGYYIDSHMLRPYNSYQKYIDELYYYVKQLC